jgi:hypothetical protein
MTTLPTVSFRNTLFYANNSRVEEINERIWDRNRPDQPLPPNFDPSPTTTKYARFPVLDKRMPTIIPIQPNFNASLEKSFAPPVMQKGPVYGFNVNNESNLRNQYFALQRGADQSIYVPSSNSDLYRVALPTPTTRNEIQDFPLLFTKSSFSSAIHPNLVNTQSGINKLHNHTREQNR